LCLESGNPEKAAEGGGRAENDEKNMSEKMITEEYLNKMDDLEKSTQRIETSETQERKGLPFTNLGVYTHLLPIVTELLDIVDKAEKNQHVKLWWMLYETSINAVTELIVGYNKYHPNHKAEIYNKVRAEISRMQALVIILAQLKQLEKEAEQRYSLRLEECIKAASSLIRTIEGKKK